MKKLLLAFALCAMTAVAGAQTQKVSVLEYCPAPGQFVNVLPEVEEGMTREQVLKACEEQLAKKGYLVHLGSFGGYITVKFDHPVENKTGSDLLITGNAMYAADDPVYGKETIGGSIEPGIVYVGVGDNVETAEWYELAGSEYFTDEYRRMRLTYYRPTAEEGEHALPGSIYDMYLKCSGLVTEKNNSCWDFTYYFPKLAAHKQTYWPMWETADEPTFEGGRLPNPAKKYEVDGRDYWGAIPLCG